MDLSYFKPDQFPAQARGLIRESGWRLVEPSHTSRILPLADWHPDTCLGADDKDSVMVVVLALAKRPGRGAFRRLVTALTSRGWSIIVFAPTGDMRGICRHMGFTADLKVNAMVLLAAAD